MLTFLPALILLLLHGPAHLKAPVETGVLDEARVEAPARSVRGSRAFVTELIRALPGACSALLSVGSPGATGRPPGRVLVSAAREAASLTPSPNLSTHRDRDGPRAN